MAARPYRLPDSGARILSFAPAWAKLSAIKQVVVPAYPSTYLRTYLPTCLPTWLPAYLTTCLVTAVLQQPFIRIHVGIHVGNHVRNPRSYTAQELSETGSAWTARTLGNPVRSRVRNHVGNHVGKPLRKRARAQRGHSEDKHLLPHFCHVTKFRMPLRGHPQQLSETGSAKLQESMLEIVFE